ncbi:dihydropteroate synthase-related protein [Archaeoglobus fulgidus DSM 8774]|uniref:Dihydropteroate synthase-related protein n=1 Tax=Archaeoglobus fulgidus DSM 8774 TaxID=1344584 RepID=A0A075WGR8_ARCFL|nr:dihydropteroate synthase-like protein [Archaeoglobus fulgidus]AIG98294.1 dihydropteroate synthase-related protein [Archaeoglobus fulgidus DSM 8774]
MRVLLVTGKLAEEMVRKYGKGADVKVYNIDIAAFITPSMLENEDFSGYDLVLVPGLTYSHNWEDFERRKGVKVRLGPIHAYDLQHVLKLIGKVEFSHKIPACRLVESLRAEETLREIDALDEDCAFEIGGVKVGGSSRMKVVAEIASFCDFDDLRAKIDHYTESGADIIDIGVPLEFDKEWLHKTLKIAVDHSKLPLSIDTFSSKAIEIAVKHGVDMVMSISMDNLKALDLIENQAVVVVERDIDGLLNLVERVGEKVERVIADPILDPPLKVAESIGRYAEFRRRDEKTPLLLGAGNVTELSDADSIGINALLAFIAEELKCNLLFTTEASPKTFGSVRELNIASYLAKAAKIRNSPPKDAGVSLLALKEKVRYEERVELDDFVRAEETREFVRDPLGDFIIQVVDGKIVCKHDRMTIVGEKAKEVADTAIKNNLLSRLDHAAYLGRELMKAEIAALLKKSYIQDRELNFGFYQK